MCQRIDWLQDYFFEVLIYLTYHEIKHSNFTQYGFLNIINPMSQPGILHS